MFQYDVWAWPRYKAEYKVPESEIVDFHDGKDLSLAYYEQVEIWKKRVMDALKSAQAEGKEKLCFTHGSSTSRQGQTTARSVVRTLMRSKITTPYVKKSESIQNESFFVAVIREKS
jgi:hypothetical protein